METSTPLLPPPRQPRYDALDLWRGVACLLVVVFHLTIPYVATTELKVRVLNHGGDALEIATVLSSYFWIGVPLFFVISGYCIAAAADSARRRPNPTRQFFIRRFRRIYPPLWIHLLLTAAIVAPLPGYAIPGPTEAFARPMPKPQEVPWISWLGSVTLTEEWRGNVIGPPKQYFSAHIWSLCYEEQFYLIAGLLVAFARRWLFLGFALTSLLVGLMLGAFDSVLPSRDGFFTDGNWLVFAAGLAVYYRVNYASLRTKLCLDGVLVLLAVWTARPLNHWAELHAGVMGNLLVGCLFALLLGWLHRWDAAISRARILLPLRYCGQMCYSLYLMHAIPTMLIAWNCYRLGITSPQATWLITVPLGVLVSVGAGRAFYLLVERRFLNAPIRDAKPDPSSTTDPSCKSTAGACGQLNPASTLASANSR